MTGIEISDHNIEGIINIIVPRMQHDGLNEEVFSNSNPSDLYLVHALFVSQLGHR
jgi:hypothetical protein